MRPTRLLLCLGAVATALIASSPAWAADPDEDDEAESKERSKLFTFGVGLMGFLGADFLDKPANNHITRPSGAQETAEYYPGFGGFVKGGGIMLDSRFIGLVGMEIDILYSGGDRGHGDYTLNGQKFKIDIGQPAWHLPMLAKVTIPLPLIRPCVMLGPEFVFPGEASASVDPSGRLLTAISAKNSNYTMITFGLGFELKLPIPAVDLRIPLTFRGSYNPSVPSDVQDRIDITWGANNEINSITYDSRWKYQTQLTLGLAYYF